MANLMSKHTQQLSQSHQTQILSALRGEQPVDLLLTNLHILDVIQGETFSGSIAILDHTIVAVGEEANQLSAKNVTDCQNMTAVPGFIDGHMHIETSTMTPFEFERTTLEKGTTSVVADPHELVNVIGQQGIEWFLRCSEQTIQNQFIQVSSCVPALPGVDISGADFPIYEMAQYLDHDHVIGLAEVMDFPSVIAGRPLLLDKISAFSDLNIDGHAPLLQGLPLSAYVLTGVQNCHETVLLEEGKEKIRKGMTVIIREGSVAKNLDTLAPLITDASSPFCLLCTDDRNPYEIAEEGHIDYMVRRLIQHHKIKPYLAYRVASWSAANHFGLKRLGMIAPGCRADINFVNQLEKVDIQRVMIAGKWVDQLNLAEQVSQKLDDSQPPLQPTMDRESVTEAQLTLELEQSRYNVIEIVDNELITNQIIVSFDDQPIEKQQINYIAYIERHGHQLPPALGLVKGFSLHSGAIATSVGHDSHNILAIGVDSKSMQLAVNHLLELGGGFCVVDRGKVMADLPLPLAGIMSIDNSENIVANIKKLKSEAKKIGTELDEPFIQMSFLALPVIPTIKMTSQGLFDVDKQQVLPLLVS
ncbi:adenine deaminase [Vibrio sp. SS-MA-C1-2]|uniref:adenine deaminase n=1 Tax=Vibrio sp. SS-MA-C1-2 TaxID=2908646 RepID=UPI001F439971|nr:adenine deaminase [Vibrio sp. SS-MA-C1-2]UJF17753.1 adenine deaminase [Vibrio sp. SS-MA-C1-2]